MFFGGKGPITSRDIRPDEYFTKKSGKFLRHVVSPAGSSLGKRTHTNEDYVLRATIEAPDGDQMVTLQPGDVLLTGWGEAGFSFEWRVFDDLIAESDVGSLFCLLTPAAEQMFGERELKMMKKTVIFFKHCVQRSATKLHWEAFSTAARSPAQARMFTSA